ncbi:MAG: transposase [Candidatus Omnitrophica bacterium]|nr:transposase [Candidatus Omnitrophota bacterium]
MRGVKQSTVSTGRMRKHRYSTEFKVTAVKLAKAPSIETQAVAAALHIHPFMLSRWKKEYREGTLKGQAHPELKRLTHMEAAVAEDKRIRELEAALKNARIENDLLKKAIQFNLERRRTASPS